MNLSNITLNQFARQHIVKQQKKQEYQVFKKNKKAEQALNPSPLLTLPRALVGEIAKFLSIKDKTHLTLTCNTLYAKPHVNMIEANYRYFNINIIKYTFENEVNQFVNLFKNNNGEFKSRDTIINEINNESIVLPEDPSVMKIGFKVVYSNLNDYEIKDLLVGIKDNISQNKLENLASIAIEKMSNDNAIRYLLGEIKEKISKDKLNELASTVFEKMSNDYQIRALVIESRNRIYQYKLVELASKAIEKMSNASEIKNLLEGIKCYISWDKLEKLKNIRNHN